jgi:hypothetical protein
MIKLTKAIGHIFLLDPTVEPIFEPSGCIDISAPAVKRLIPRTRHTTPTKNRNISPVDMGTMVMPSRITISAIGNTDFSDSVILSLNKVNLLTPEGYFSINFLICVKK